VQSHPRSRFGLRLFPLIGLAVLADAAHLQESGGARAVQVGETNAELAAARLFVAPHDFGLHRDVFGAAAETTEERLPHLRQVGRSQVHAGQGNVDALRLEGVRHLAPDLDNRFERNAQRLRVPPIVMNAHRFLHRLG
jgi:hypothetical protein